MAKGNKQNEKLRKNRGYLSLLGRNYLKSNVGNTTSKKSKGEKKITNKIQEVQQVDIRQKAKAVGLLRVLKGVGEVAVEKGKEVSIKKQIKEVQDLQRQAKTNTQVEETIRTADEVARYTANTEAQRLIQMQKIREEQIRTALENARKKVKKPGKKNASLTKELIKNKIRPDKTSMILNAGVPGLGLVYKLLKRLS